MKNKKYLVLTIIWLMFIFYMSNQSSDIYMIQSADFINLLSNIPIIGSFVDIFIYNNTAQHIIRKLAHVFIYFVISILWFYTMYNKTKDKYKSFKYAFILTVICASFDEFHQLFIPGRSGSITDVMIDSFGGFIGLIFIYFFGKI